jgi:predicted RNase H-like nuclease
MGLAVGVDGCKFGWIAVTNGENGALRYALFRALKALFEHHRDAERVFVDIPIGLPWRACPSRPCDVMARRTLGSRHVCVFTPPCRAAARLGDKSEARKANLNELGRSLSEQALGICLKVNEADALMRTDASARTRIREVHPEVCFWALNGGTPLMHGKTTSAGIRARLELLSRREPLSKQLLQQILREQPRTHVKADDVLDALVAYVTAAEDPVRVSSLRGVPQFDQEGLPMEMLYVGPGAAVA